MAAPETHHANPLVLPAILLGVAIITVFVAMTQGALDLGGMGDSPPWFWTFLVAVLGATFLVWWLVFWAKARI